MKINIGEIENSELKSKYIEFSQIYDEFNREVPVKAKLNIGVSGNIVKVQGEIIALVNHVCDVCLKEFSREYTINVEEFFTKGKLNKNDENDFEIRNDGFIEDLNNSDIIDLNDLIYQCVILNLPNKLVCDINCNGDENLSKYLKSEFSDPRLEVFKNIKIEKDN